jgi:hypothetical protein
MELLRFLKINSMSLNEPEQENPFEMNTKGWALGQFWALEKRLGRRSYMLN